MVANGFGRIYIHFICARYEHFIKKIFTVPEAHKYEQNKRGTTGTDYEHKNRKKQELCFFFLQLSLLFFVTMLLY